MSFAPLSNDTFLRACRRQATDYTPLWLMRQAGRYLPEYKATRARAGSFMGLATNVDYATEVTLQPLERFPLDAAILFSDILTVPDAMGLGLSFAEGEGPRFARQVRDEAAVAELAVPDMDKLRYVFDAVTSIRKALNGRVPLIGFSGSPWTLACYMVEGKGSDDYRLVKSLMYARPDLMHRILAINADSVAAYLNAQIDAGAQAVMIFDSWGGVLADGAFQEFSLAYTKRVLAQLKRTGVDGTDVPRIVFTKGGGIWLPDMKDLECEVLGLDWTANLGHARALVGGQVGGPGKALQGNIDPNVLFAPPAQIAAQVRHVLDSFGKPHTDRSTTGPTHIFNLGHGISQFTPPEHVSALVEAVHSHSRAQRQG
ncbi:uroporphyrinogen decarboxylase [Acidovorax sp. sic0104]|uniref:uroporphyrinogen decarboxylase n=1 Tax=Acidovorax sp. sic0104 TaxID=2854784 RepID=UPI001C45B61F|nr:uroporphyrinogen decarboxylase [Acidovorax sp. sic0104]MBV7542929.1 uroporphyrinogen decarboxylase [Acidovorax sp. sic0104]